MDRLAVRVVTDNVVIQFVPPETHGGIAIERLAGGNIKPDAPPRGIVPLDVEIGEAALLALSR